MIWQFKIIRNGRGLTHALFIFWLYIIKIKVSIFGQISGDWRKIMTMLYPVQVSCGMCEHPSKAVVIAKTNTVGAPDLDTRPPQMQRSTIIHWVHRCPACHYCAPDIAGRPWVPRTFLNTLAYRDAVSRRAYPEKSRQFLGWAIIANEIHEADKAAWSTIHAAWIADDEGADTAALQCRLLAVERIDTLLDQGFYQGENLCNMMAVKTDLLRRAARFDEARTAAATGLGTCPNEVIAQIQEFQKYLIDLKDSTTHRVDEALSPKGV
jgi:hypothetical protein